MSGMDVRGGMDWPRESDVRLGDEAGARARDAANASPTAV